MSFKFFRFLLFLFIGFSSYAQEEKSPKSFWPDTSTAIQFLDTSNFFVTDSFVMRLGSFTENVPSTMYKKFKYIGNDTLLILKAWTNDPHYICGHPKGPLVPEKVYTIRVCFYFKGRLGKFRKGMGFKLSNGEHLNFYFTGTLLPKQ